jgi:DNA-binding SARP family transcriptional activator
VTPRGRKARALLAYLISSRGSKISRVFLTGLLWGDRGEAQARSSLRQALWELRISLNRSREFVCSDRDHIWLRVDTLVEHSADERGGFKRPFEDLDDVSPDFDEWLAGERHRRSKSQTAALKEEAEKLLRSGHWDETLALVEQIEAIDPHNEEALQLGMEADFGGGHPAAIAERFRLATAQLYADLGVEPSEEIRRLRDHLIGRLTADHKNKPSTETDQEYFTRRVREEQEAVARAETQESRAIHQLLADRYAKIAEPLVKSIRGWETPDDQSSTVGTARYLRKSLVIQAVQWFMHGDHPAVLGGSAAGRSGHIDTPEGRLRVDPGDWIITGVAGENYPCKPAIFEQLYARDG